MGSQDYSRTLNLKLRELENVARDAGDNELGDCLRKISQSSNSLSSLHRALVDRRRQTKSSTQQHFFNSFRYKQEHLSKHQIQRLVLATEDWEVQEHPSLFWVCPATDTNIIQRCYSDLDRIRRVDPIRRKVLLILQYQSVCVEQREHHHTRKSRSRSGPKDGPQAILQRDSGFLTVALRSLSARLWPQLTQEQQNERAKFISEDSRCGSKWALLDEDSIVLSITSAKSSR
ncbi:hypothetical protein EMCG_01057 [[Emmonsia] crescens]|uniref:Uncharacterized protein n=1 Tax=[Emmonsia] crescens TaxID=73230 RepID=A0A0G2JBY8_9EURO|nr:hypothetical protein EMCG_01057 [Emmonsia crescens UAMH 3008]